MNLFDTIISAQNGGVVRQMAGRLNLDEGQARTAIGALLPALTRGVSRNAASDRGLEDLLGALARGGHQRYLDSPEVLREPAALEEGNGILGHILGSKEVSREVASRASASSGVDSGVLKQMLPMLASVAMGAMAKQGFGGGAAAAEPHRAGLAGMLTSFLDADKDGSIADDLLGMAGKLFR